MSTQRKQVTVSEHTRQASGAAAARLHLLACVLSAQLQCSARSSHYNVSMQFLTRHRLRIAVPLVLILLVGVTVFVLSRHQDIRSRSAQITVGMPREQVEEILGPPALELPRSVGEDRLGRGTALIWVDQFWQVDVVTDREGRVESVGSMRSDSLYRPTIGRFIDFPR